MLAPIRIVEKLTTDVEPISFVVTSLEITSDVPGIQVEVIIPALAFEAD